MREAQLSRSGDTAIRQGRCPRPEDTQRAGPAPGPLGRWSRVPFTVLGVPSSRWERLLGSGSGSGGLTGRPSVSQVRLALRPRPRSACSAEAPSPPAGSPISPRRRGGLWAPSPPLSTKAQKSLAAVPGCLGLSRRPAGDSGWFWAGVGGAAGPRPNTSRSSCSLCRAFSVSPQLPPRRPGVASPCSWRAVPSRGPAPSPPSVAPVT